MGKENTPLRRQEAQRPRRPGGISTGRIRIFAYLAVMGIFFVFCWASSVLGRVMVSTPLWKFASTLPWSTWAGSSKERWKAPKRRRTVVVLLLFFLLLLLLALDRQDVIGDRDLDILFVQARQLGGDLIDVALVDHVDGRGQVGGGRPKGLQIEAVAPEAWKAVSEILEQMVDLLVKLLKGMPPPLGAGWLADFSVLAGVCCRYLPWHAPVGLWMVARPCAGCPVPIGQYGLRDVQQIKPSPDADRRRRQAP